MSKVRRQPVLGKKDAEDLGVSPLTGASRPDFKLDDVAIRRACSLGKLPEAQWDKLVKVIGDLASDYIIERRADAMSVTAKSAHDLATILDAAASDIRAVLEQRLVSPFVIADLEEALPQVAKAAASLRREAGEPRRGGGTKEKADAQVEVARQLLEVFNANGWPMKTGPKSLMAEALRICLKAGGTKASHSSRILGAAKKDLHD